MPSVTRPSSNPSARRSPAAEDLRSLRSSLTRTARRPRSRWSLPRILAVVILVLMAVPVADAIAGSGHASVGCHLVSIVDGDTLTLECPETGLRQHQVMGLSSPPILGASCLSEAWWGLRAQIALRSTVWQSRELEFIIEPRAHLALVFADGVPLHRLITRAPANLCA